MCERHRDRRSEAERPRFLGREKAVIVGFLLLAVDSKVGFSEPFLYLGGFAGHDFIVNYCVSALGVIAGAPEGQEMLRMGGLSAIE